MLRIAAMRFFFSHYFAVSDEVDLNPIADAESIPRGGGGGTKEVRSLQRSFA